MSGELASECAEPCVLNRVLGRQDKFPSGGLTPDCCLHRHWISNVSSGSRHDGPLFNFAAGKRSL